MLRVLTLVVCTHTHYRHEASFPEAWSGSGAAAARRAAAHAAVAAAEARIAAGSDGGLLTAEPRLKMLAGARLDGRLVAAFSALHGPPGAAATLAAVHADVRRRCAAVLATLGADEARAPDALYDAVAEALAQKRRILREADATLAQPAAA